VSKGAPINLFGVGVAESRKSLNVTANSRVNIYYDIQPAPGDKTQIAAYGMPGLDYAFTLPDPGSPVQCMHSSPYLGVFVLQNYKLYQLTSSGYTAIGSVMVYDPTAYVRFAMTSGGDQLLIAVPGYTYCYDQSAGTLTAVTDLPTAISVTFQDGYFIAIQNIYDNGKFYISSLYDATTWDALDYGVAEFSPDNLYACVSKNSVLYLLGSTTYEVWQNVGDLNFPFQRITGATKELGLYALGSISSIGSDFIAMFINPQGDIGFYKVSGYEAQNITPPDLSYKLRNADSVFGCTACSYSCSGHDFYEASFNGESWVYDSLTGMWSQVKSGNDDRHLAMYAGMVSGVPFLDPYVGVYANNAYTLVASYKDGRIFVLNEESYEDDGETNYRELIGNHIFLPDRGTFRIVSISLDMEAGSVPIGESMTVRLALSRNGGHTFDEEYSDSCSTGEYTRFFQFNRLGRGRDVVPKIRMTEPVKFVLLGAVADIAPYGW